MSHVEEFISILKKMGIQFEHKEFTARQSVVITSGDPRIFGCSGGFVEIKFTLEGKCDCVGIYPKAGSNEEAPKKITEHKAPPPPPPPVRKKQQPTRNVVHEIEKQIETRSENQELTDLFSQYRKGKR